MRIAARLAAVLVGLALVGPPAGAGAQEIYRWYDRDGNVYYTQQPPPPDALRAPPSPAPVAPPTPPPPALPAAERTSPPAEPCPAPPANAEADLGRALEAYRRGDYAMVVDILRPLAQHGEATAQSRLAGLFEHGAGVEQDFVEAARRYR